MVDVQCIIAEWKNEFNLKGIHFIFSAATPSARQQPSQHIILIFFSYTSVHNAVVCIIFSPTSLLIKKLCPCTPQIGIL